MSRSTKWLTLLFVFGTAQASEANLSWTEPTQNEDGSPLTDLTSYEIHYGCSQSGVYGSVEYLSAPATAYTVLGLPDVGTCYFAAKAVNSQSIASAYSNEATRSFGSPEVPGPVVDTAITWQESSVMALSQVSTGSSYNKSGDPWTTTALTKDAGTASGDVIVIGLSYYENASDTSPDAITGFTQRHNVVYGDSGVHESRLVVWTRDADGGEASTFTVGRASNDFYGSAFIATFRGSGTLTYASSSAGSPATAEAITSPSMSGDALQGLLAIYAISDPVTNHSQTEGMTLAVTASTASNTGRIYYEDLAATEATGTRELTWTTAEKTVGIAMLLDGADVGAAGAPENFLTLLGVGH